MDNGEILLYRSPQGKTEIDVRLQDESVWLNQYQIADLFQTDRSSITKHIVNIYESEELVESSTCAKFSQVQKEGKRLVTREVNYYNLDVIISVGYRVQSAIATQFRQWATQRLKDYLVKGYAINEKRLAQKQQEVEYLKTGIRILNRAIEQQASEEESQMLKTFAKGLELLDAYDHQTLENKGLTITETVYPGFDEYMKVIRSMYSDFESDVFAKPKDESFHSSINQIRQSFGGVELYPSIEEKSTNLLYFIVKNHSFLDGNKRIAAACFLYFLEKNNALYNSNGIPVISNVALASLTLFIATSKTDEADIVKRFVINILNLSK